jgi:hypothetical protein
VLAVVVLGAFVGCFGPGGVKVENPAPIAAAGSLEGTEQAILDALPKRGWTTETVEPNRIVAFLPVRTHLLRVQIRYDAQQVSIAYVSSDNLMEEKAKDGSIYTHKKVNGWMKKLAVELQEDLAAAAAAPTSGGVAVPAEQAVDPAGATLPAGSGQVPAPNQ